MADKQINELTAATTINDSDLFVLQQSNTAKKITGATFKSLMKGANGTNGTNGTAATVTVGTVTTGAAGTQASVTNSGTSNAAVLNFTIPRGSNGTGSGDMLKSNYDSDSTVSNAGGIKAYIDGKTGIFPVTYGITTAAEISAALAARKLPVCRYNNEKNYIYSYESSDKYYFISCGSSSHYVMSVSKSASTYARSTSSLALTGNYYTKTEIDTKIGDIESALAALR